MRFLRVISLAIVGTLSVVSLHAQTADEIINKHIDAMGGKDKLSTIKTIYTHYDMVVMGNQASGVTYLVNGKGYRNEVDLGGQKIIQCLTDKGGWGINPMAGQTKAEALPADQAKMSQGQLDAGGPLFNYAAKGNTVELQGNEQLNGVNAYKLKLKGKEGNESTFWIDPSTFYIIKSTNKVAVNGEDVETTIALSNYKKTDYGFMIPGTTEVTLPQGLTLNITSKKVEINKDIDMTLFDMPK